MIQLGFCKVVLLLTILFQFPGILVKASSDCDVDKIRGLDSELGFDGSEIENYQYLIKKTVQCSMDTNSTSDKTLLLQLRNQISYKLGLLQLSLNQNLKAINIFESITIDDSYKDSYTDLALKRLDELYIAFGYWDKVKNDEDEMYEMYHLLNKTLHDKIQTNKGTEIDETLQDELKPMLGISPYDYNLLSVNIGYLTKRLSTTLDPLLANELLRSYEVILDQYKTKLTLGQRLEIHYIISIVQMFILNADPSNQLRKCLAIDMDYSLCKQLTLFNSGISKVNPHKSQLLDPQMFAFSKENNPDQLGEDKWNFLLDFYLNEKTKPCLKINEVKDGYKFVTNYKLVNDFFVPKCLKTLFEDLYPLEGSKLFDIEYQHDVLGNNNYFNRFINVAICEATEHGTKSKIKSLSANVYCKQSLKQVLNEEQWGQFRNTMTKMEPLPEGFLTELWNTYPTLTIHIIDKILHKNKKQTHNKLMEQVINFFKEQKLSSSINKHIIKQVNYVNNMVEKINKGRQQQQHHQQQQQQFHFNFGQQQNQYQQHQNRAPPSPPPVASDKDYYKILGVSKEASAKDIRKSYLNLTKKYHPDKQGALSESEKKKVHEKMSEINEAYETLSDEDKKDEYDAARSGHGANRQFQQRQQQQGSPFGGRPVNFMFQQGGGRPFPF